MKTDKGENTDMGERKTRKTASAAVLIIAFAMIGSTFLALAGFMAAGAAASPAQGLTAGLSPNPIAIDAGQTVTLTATVSGGSGTYSGQWYSGPFANDCAANTPVSPGGTFGPGAGPFTFAVPTPILQQTYYCYTVSDTSTPTALTGTSAVDLLTIANDLVASSVATVPAPAAIESGQPVTLTAVTSGGVGTDTYQWYSTVSTGPACGPAAVVLPYTTETITVTPTANIIDFCYIATDSSVGTGSGSAASTQPSGGAVLDEATVHVYNAMTLPVPTVPVAPTEPGAAPISFSESGVTGGAGPDFVQWYNSTTSAAACSSGHGAEMTGDTGAGPFPDTPQVDTWYCYSATDTGITVPITVFSAASEVVVMPALTAAPVTADTSIVASAPGSVSIDLGTTPTGVTTEGATLQLVGAAVGGVSGPSYQWRSGQFATCSADSTTGAPATPKWGNGVSTGPVPSTSTYYCYGVSDILIGPEYSPTVLVTVNPALSAGAPTPVGTLVTPLLLDLGGKVTLTAAPTGGTQPYSYQWFSDTGNPGHCLNVLPGETGPSVTVSPAALGTTEYCYTVTDSSFGSINQETSAPSPVVYVSVASALSAVATPTGPLAAVDPGAPPAGVTITLPASAVTGGTPSYLYQFYNSTVSASACSGGTGTLMTGLGDSGPYTGLATPITDFPQVTTWYCVKITDASVGSPSLFSLAVMVTVNAPLSAGAVTSNGVSIDSGALGETLALTPGVSGGSGTYAVTWTSGPYLDCAFDLTTQPSGHNSQTLSVLTWDERSGAAYVCYSVSDGIGGTALTTTGFHVSVVTGQAALTPTAPPPPVYNYDPGQGVTLAADQTGGVLPYSYQWFSSTVSAADACNPLSVTRLLIAGATNSSFVAHPPAALTTYFCYRVTDSSFGTPSEQSIYPLAGVAVVVNAALTAPAPTCTSVSLPGSCPPPISNVAPGETVTLGALPTGGAGTYTWQWYSGTSSVCASDTPIPGATTPGVYTYSEPSTPIYFCYTVTDQQGFTAMSGTLYDPPGTSSPAAPFLVGAAEW